MQRYGIATRYRFIWVSYTVSVYGCCEPCFLLTLYGWLHLTYGLHLSTALAVDQGFRDNYSLAFLEAQMALK